MSSPKSQKFQIVPGSIGKQSVPIKAWIDGVPVEEEAKEQLRRIAQLPIVYKWVSAMPDVHVGKGATVGSVIPTLKAIIPAAVGVDIGCGMMAVQTTLRAKDLPDNLYPLRSAIEKAVPHGRTVVRGKTDKGSWQKIPQSVFDVWARLDPRYQRLIKKYPKLGQGNDVNQLGTLGTGNHFIEICIDESKMVWVMLHSGSRGVGNRMGTFFIEKARTDMKTHIANLPDKDLAYFKEGTEHFDDYVEAVEWAQEFARFNREIMMESVLSAMRALKKFPAFQTAGVAVNCHHNYVSRENHFGQDVFVTRKGAVRAREGEWGIIPGSMGAQSFIVKGKGNPESFSSCSHGAGRKMSRAAARKKFSVEDHKTATEGIECRKDEDVIDETPGAYKNIERVMAAQSDLVEIVHTLKQVVVVKG